MGCSPHNCGGAACGIAAHVAGGRVVRFTTDDRPSYDMIENKGIYDSQRRGCVRCRSKKQWLYRPDRLLYPLKQTKERGDLSGFVKISWAQAASEIANEIKRIKDTYGPESFHKFYSTGDGAEYPRSCEFSAFLLYGLGGEYAYHDDYSLPSWYTAGYFTWGKTYPGANSAPDLQNTKTIVLWSGNPSETIGTCNVSWYLTQARDMGVPVICVDQRISKTASMLATGAENVPAVITPVGGTDGALIAAMLYHLVSKHIETVDNDDIWQTTKYLNPRMVAKYVHGFFDKLPDDMADSYSYRAEVTKENYPVADGGSYSAYIFGNKQIAFNNKPSIYPEEIGYNTSNVSFDWYAGVDDAGNILTENRPDNLHGKKTKCYGQTEKTPEWAEKITGVSADTIKAFAEYLAEVSYNNNWGGISLLQIGGFQRNTEGEQGIRAFFVLAGVLGCFGQNGSTFGMPSAAAAKDSSVLPSFKPHKTPWADSNLKANIKAGSGLQSITAGINITKRFDDTKLTNAVSNKESGTGNASFPVFMWQDAIEKGATGTSRWGAPDVANGPAIKLIFNFGGNCVVNQAGDYNLTTQILKMQNHQSVSEDANYPNRKYQLELLVTSDFFMTSSAQYSDYVLPAAMAFERNFYKTVDDAVHFSPKAVDAPGEVLSDYEMTWRIHDYLGGSFTGGLTGADTEIRDERLLLKSIYNAPTAGEYAGMTFEEFVQKGLVTSGTQVSNPISIQWKEFREAPGTQITNSIGELQYPVNTPTGKIEAYSQGMCEYYEARGFNNDDATVQLVNGSIKTKGETYTNGMYVYPVPMYIPLVEGRHACDKDESVDASFKHPDPLGTNANGYTYRLHNWHMQYRSHSTLNSNAYLNELYKKDINGNPAFYSLDRGQNKVYGAEAAVCDENVYEPVFVSPNTAAALGITEKGSRVVIYNDRGAIYAYAQISKLVQDNDIMIGQGAWASVINETFTTPNGRKHKIDTGGCSNTLMSIRPSRICQGMTLSNDTKVGIKVI